MEVLLIDDIQFLCGKEGIQEGLFHTFNELHNANHQIIITCDRLPSALSPLEDRLKSRFEGGLITDIQAPMLETRIAVLQAKAASLKVSIPADVVELLGRSFSNNIRDLEGALNRVAAYADLTSHPITMELARLALADLLNNLRQPLPQSEGILSTVCRFYSVSLDSLYSKQKDRKLVLARQIAMYLLREDGKKTFTEIGALLGGRNHTTILHGWEKISHQKEKDLSLQDTLLSLKESIR